MFMTAITRSPFTYTTFSFLFFNLMDTWEFHLSLLLCIVYICACISFWLISFYLWLVLVFLFNKIYYEFTPLRHQTSQHYTSQHASITDGYNNSHAFWIMDSSYCHSSYWLSHVRTDMPTFQIHFMFTPHACGLLGVLNLLYSQCCGMVIWKLNYSYRHRWNGALHCGHLFLTNSKMIKHYGRYMCWQVPKIHAPSGSNGEQQIRHSSPFCVKSWGVGHNSSLIFVDTSMTYS
jgi:uncharacterized membrane protein YciS (DUF1049 family)